MEQVRSSRRIWEIDAARGLCIPGMILIHLIYDVVNLYGFVDWPYPQWYSLFKNNYGALFVLLSGLSVTLGSRCVRRGLQVFGWGMVITAVTAGMYLLHLADRGILIYFGVLHCLGVCMVLWHWLRRCSARELVILGILMVLTGWWLRTQVFSARAFLVLGFVYPGFRSSDYFPLLPNLGYFLLGAAAGRTLYRDRTTRFPQVCADGPAVRLLSGMGRHSLLIYLLHQPVLSLMCQAVIFFRKLG